MAVEIEPTPNTGERPGTAGKDLDPDISKRDSMDIAHEGVRSFSPSTAPNDAHEKADTPSDQLCTTCSRVAFELLLVNLCDCTAPAGLSCRGKIRLSTVGTIRSNKACPACRLVGSLITSYPERLPDAAEVSLFAQQAYAFEQRGIRDSRLPLDKEPRWIDVSVCSHGVEGVEGGGKDYAVGSLLPAKGDRWDTDTGAGYDRLFECSVYDGNVFGRPMPERVDCALLKAWMKFCEKEHEECGKGLVNDSEETSVRFIDVRERKLVTANLKEEYLALSYVWGPDTPGVLTKDTIDQYRSAGSMTKAVVPPVVSDAMELVAELGERYLWVDTACIVQDDLLDKQRQLPVMDSIYSHAKLVVIARVDSARCRLPRWGAANTQHGEKVHTEVLRGTRFTTGKPCLASALHDAIWRKRGWTYQEGLLARRALIFTESQVYWNCREEAWTEDRHTEFKDVRHSPTANNSLLGPPVKRTCGGQAAEIGELCTFGEYSKNVEEFSKRMFRNRSDVLWAFVGILKSLMDKLPRGFIWALPRDELDAAVLWRSDCAYSPNIHHLVQDEGGSVSSHFIPSWCWIGKGCRVWYEACGASVVSLVKWYEPLRYSKEYDMQAACTGCLEEEIKSSAFVGVEKPTIQLSTEVLDFGLLHFSAQVATLRLQLVADEEEAKHFPGHTLAGAKIQLPSGEDISEMMVPLGVFRDGREEHREFILLSSNVVEEEMVECCGEEDGPHMPGCKHSPALNIMLIEWRENGKGRKVALRVAIGKMEESAWAQAGAKEKDIILA